MTVAPAPGWSLYGNLSRGGREPAFRDLYDPQDYWSQRVELEPEDLTDYELGGEQHFRTGFARVNLYWLHFDNEIVCGGLDSDGVPVTANGAVTDHRGVELEAAWTPLPRWGARLALSLSRNTFAEFVEYDWDGDPTDRGGNPIAGARTGSPPSSSPAAPARSTSSSRSATSPACTSTPAATTA